MIRSSVVILRMKNVSDKDVEKIKTHILCAITFFENHAVFEIMWKNTVERGKPQMKIWLMRIGYWVP